MGTMTFHLPSGLSESAAAQLELCCMAGGPDNMPWPTSLDYHADSIRLTRDVDESGFLAAPWPVPGHGSFMGCSATLMDRQSTYDLLVELARGKVNQVRNQAEEWRTGGLHLTNELNEMLRATTLAFGRAVCQDNAGEREAGARRALDLAHQAGERLVRSYLTQVFEIRHAKNPQLDTALSVRLDESVFDPEIGAAIKQACNRVCLPLSWHVVEADETVYRWDRYDKLLDWAEANELDVTAGPLIDFSSTQLPAWLWLWERDVPSMLTFMCRFVEAAVRRYRARIRRWQLTAASNWASVLSLTEDELLTLTYRTAETARQVDAALELVIGISQPWGEYMALADRTHSPFVFADNLIRSGLNVSALDVEVVMGVYGRGSYCRDTLELSRMLDLYSILGVPLQATIGYPSSPKIDPDADPELTTGFGSFRDRMTPELQAEWAETFGGLALCKPNVREVQWAHLSDAKPHLFPNCGLVGRDGKSGPAVAALRKMREEHLR